MVRIPSSPCSMSKYPWATNWTPNCSWWAAGPLHGHQCMNVCESVKQSEQSLNRRSTTETPKSPNSYHWYLKLYYPPSVAVSVHSQILYYYWSVSPLLFNCIVRECSMQYLFSLQFPFFKSGLSFPVTPADPRLFLRCGFSPANNIQWARAASLHIKGWSGGYVKTRPLGHCRLQCHGCFYPVHLLDLDIVCRDRALEDVCGRKSVSITYVLFFFFFPNISINISQSGEITVRLWGVVFPFRIIFLRMHIYGVFTYYICAWESVSVKCSEFKI